MELCNEMSEGKYDGLLRMMDLNHTKLTTQAKLGLELRLLLGMVGTPAPLKSEELLNSFMHERWLHTRFEFWYVLLVQESFQVHHDTAFAAGIPYFEDKQLSRMQVTRTTLRRTAQCPQQQHSRETT